MKKDSNFRQEFSDFFKPQAFKRCILMSNGECKRKVCLQENSTEHLKVLTDTFLSATLWDFWISNQKSQLDLLCLLLIYFPTTSNRLLQLETGRGRSWTWTGRIFLWGKTGSSYGYSVWPLTSSYDRTTLPLPLLQDRIAASWRRFQDRKFFKSVCDGLICTQSLTRPAQTHTCTW